MMDAVAVLKIAEAAAITPAGRLEPVMRVQYTVGQHGPFFHDFPKADFDPAAALRKLEEFARKLELLSPPR